MIRAKANVNVDLLHPDLWAAMPMLASVLATEFDVPDCWITSANDADHSGQPVDDDTKDPHYMGKAVDLRSHDVRPELREACRVRLAVTLGPNYVVLLEHPGSPNEHYHVQRGHVRT